MHTLQILLSFSISWLVSLFNNFSQRNGTKGLNLPVFDGDNSGVVMRKFGEDRVGVFFWLGSQIYA